MIQEVPTAVHIALVIAIFWSVLCRASRMSGETYLAVRLQHGLLLAGAVASLLAPPEWRAPVIAGGAALFLSLSSSRWRHEAPEGTKPTPLDEVAR
jgi:hypothetical protein